MDRILIRMPEWDYFLPAASVVQNYISQQYFQLGNKMKFEEPKFTIEVGDDSHLFLASMFPRLEVTMREQDEIKRADWDCVLDLRDINRALRVAAPTHKHLTEVWGAMFGATATKLPILGPIAVTCQKPSLDFLIDAELECGAIEGLFFEPAFSVKVVPVNGQRICDQFQLIADAKVYVGKRSGATYLAATMGKGCVELWPLDMPTWFLDKPTSDGYRRLMGDLAEWSQQDNLFKVLKEIYFPLLMKAA